LAARARAGSVGLGCAELVPRVRPASDFDDRALRTGVNAVVDAVGVGLQEAPEILEKRGRAVAGMRRRVVERDARMIGVADIVPEPAITVLGPRFVANRHRGVVGVQYLRLQNVRFENQIHGPQQSGAGGHPVAHRRARNVGAEMQ